VSNQLTAFGFDWGPMKVMRAYADNRYHTLLIHTDHLQLELSISPTGRKARFFQLKKPKAKK